MKSFIFVLVFLCLVYRAVYGAKSKGLVSLQIEPLTYSDNGHFIKAGSAAKIKCKASTKNSKVNWYDPSGNFVGHQVSNDKYVQDNVVLSKTAPTSRGVVLYINSAAVDDSGIWECRSGILKRNISLCILDPVEFLDSETKITVDLGRSVTLSCQLRGEPEPTIQWERNGEIIADDGNSSKYKTMTSFKNQQWLEGLLTVTSLEPGDSGVYTCVTYQENNRAADCTDTARFNVTLNINYAPIFDTGNHTEDYYILDNESFDLICAPDAFPTPTFRWFYEIGEMLSEIPETRFNVSNNGSDSTLSLIANTKTFDMIYVCRATNVYGETFKRFRIQELTKPSTPCEIENQYSSNDELAFNCTQDGDNVVPPTADGIEVQYILKESRPRASDWKRAKTVEFASSELADNGIHLTDLEKDTSYWVRLRAVNSVGYSDWSSPVKAATTNLDVDLDSGSDGIIYAIIITVGIVVFAVGCMFVVRRI